MHYAVSSLSYKLGVENVSWNASDPQPAIGVEYQPPV